MLRWIVIGMIALLGGQGAFPAQAPAWEVVERCVQPATAESVFLIPPLLKWRLTAI